MVHLAPSILAADFSNLGQDIATAQNAGVQYFHLDVMDGHFVPNISFGTPVIQSIAPHIYGIMDIHLMVTNPEKYIEEYIQLGANIITVHYETCTHLNRIIDMIKQGGAQAGVSINPATPVAALVDIVHCVDMILVMSVNPGFGGQSFIPHTLKKIRQVREMAPNVLIEVDGGITLANVNEVIKAGANLIVAGSSVFEKEKISENVKKFYKIFKE
ncbi:ribulose-phosphate 3-epimerase [Candidatus Epulonipiscium viviparus]|uniref:ribulose-phosphate 3-epimerase n=1 Tax=Candidatus Epulonipiscium viviparus TaxID=420336 RepID=UPI002738096B|nr:ribulose-phosphate 3-epimerase [Candidatus Epulopiscium viviparus]